MLFLPALLFFVLAALYFYLPDYMETRLIHFIPETTGIDHITLDVRKISPFETDIASLVIGEAKNPALKIESIRSDYSPAGLSEGLIKDVVISGVELYCDYYNGKFSLRGLDQNKILNTIQSLKHRPGKKPGPADLLPIQINRIELRDAVVICRYNETEFRLPVEVVMTRKRNAPPAFKGIIKIYPRGQAIIITASIDLTKKIALVTLKGNRIRLERFADLAKAIPGLVIRGAADLDGTADLRFDPPDIAGIRVSCTIHEPQVAYKDLLVSNARSPEKKKEPVQLKITGKGLKEWNMNLSSLAFLSPLPAGLKNLSCHLNVTDGKKEARGIFSFIVNRTAPPGPPFILDEPIPVNGSYHAKASKDRGWEFSIETDNLSGKKPEKININGCKISLKAPQWIVLGKGIGARGILEYRMGVSGLHAISKYGSAHIPEAVLEGTANLDLSEKVKIQSVFACDLMGTKLSVESLKINVPNVSVSGKIHRKADNAFRLTGVTQLLNANVRDAKHNIKANGIGLFFPFAWPPERSGEKGALSIKSIYRDNLSIGSVKGNIKQQKSGLEFDGKYSCGFLPDFSVDFYGTSGLSYLNDLKTNVKFSVPEYLPRQDIDLGQFLDPLKGTTVNGRFSLDASLSMNKNGTNSMANIHFTDGKLVNADKNFKVKGIRTDLLITDLLNLQSAPEQRIDFNNASLGEIAISNGSVRFRIESLKSFFIEKSSFNWCNGNVYAHAIRVSPGIDDYNLTLFCDRINLAMLLRQFGTLNADGVGSVNGRIPIKFSKGNITFNDGFLYSTPGNGGTVKVTGAEILTAGIPPDTLQYTQIELAREALKDYTYKWVKLGLTTEGNNLYLKMEFDGKPSHPLPFVYNKDIGGFTRVKGNSKGSHFQGISLDVNFRVPINEILQYGEGLKDIFNRNAR